MHHKIPNGWNSKKLGVIAEFINGMAFKPSDWERTGLPIIRIQNLNGSPEFNYYTKPVGDRYYVNRGDLLFSWSGSRGTSFGPFIWRGVKGILNQHIFRVVENDGVDKKFLYHQLKHITEVIEKRAHGSAGLVHITKDALTKFLIDLPEDIREQNKIADVLSAWDRAIEILSKLINTNAKLKKGLMQKLLTGKTRFKEFKEHWEDYEYDDLFETVSAKKKQVAKEKYKTIGKYPIVDQGQSRIAGYTDEDKVFCDVPIIVFGDHTRIIKWVDFPFVVGADGTQLLKTKSVCDLKYGFYVLSNLRLPSLGYSRHFKVVKETTFYVPSNPKEQAKITETFSSADHEFDLLSSMLDMLKIQKKSLMQKLLTGKIRVKGVAK